LPFGDVLGELGQMTNLSRAGGAWMAVLVWLVSCAAWAADPAATDAFAATARRAGLRVISSERLVLVTDRPPRDGDGVDDLPPVFDQAFAGWCRHYGIAADSLPQWRACGCLMADRERFRAAGLLPADLPAFTNGFCLGDHFWLADQSNPAYRRHLLLHEGVHAFTLTVRSLAAPPWYTEGIAEYLATHRLERAADGPPRLIATPLPDRAADVEQLGRIEHLRRLHATGAAPAFEAVLAATTSGHGDISAYAANWAAVTMLARHPQYAERFKVLERGPLDAAFTERLAETDGWDEARASRDFDAFTADVDYGFDFARSAIDWSPGRPLTAPAKVQVDATRGWQNTGLRLTAGHRYALAATGRCTLGTVVDPTSGESTTLASEARGISLRWYRSRPIGRLIAAQWVDRPAAGRPRFEPLAEGGTATVTAVADGPLYLTINESPGELADNAGGLTVDVRPAP
jgi:hypothetical protein